MIVHELHIARLKQHLTEEPGILGQLYYESMASLCSGVGSGMPGIDSVPVP